MSEPTAQHWLSLQERCEQSQRELAQLIQEVEQGRELTPDELQQFEEVLLAIRTATKLVRGIEYRLQRHKLMASQAPNN